MQRASYFVVLGLFVGVLTACEHTPPSPLAPSAASLAPSSAAVAVVGDAAHVETNAHAHWGAVTSTRRLSMSAHVDVPCGLGPFGLADHSNFVSTPSGNELLVCSGSTAAADVKQATILTDFPCVLPSETVTTDSRLVLTPSGHVTLTCRAHK